MAEDPREIANMVEKSMGAGGAPVSMEDQLALEIQDDIDELPEGIELDTGEQTEVMAEPYNHDANLAEVLDEAELASIASDLQGKVREDLESRQDW